MAQTARPTPPLVTQTQVLSALQVPSATPSRKTSRWRHLLSSVWFQIALAVFLIATLTVFYFKLNKEASERLANYAAILYGSGIVLSVIAFLEASITTSQEALAERERLRKLFSEVNWWTTILDRIRKTYPYSFRLWREMNTQDAQLQHTALPAVDPVQQTVNEEALADFIFGNMQQEFLRLGADTNWTAAEFAAIIRIWRRWLRSPTLQNYWRTHKQFQDDQFKQFIDDQMQRSWEPWNY